MERISRPGPKTHCLAASSDSDDGEHFVGIASCRRLLSLIVISMTREYGVGTFEFVRHVTLGIWIEEILVLANDRYECRHMS